MTRWSSHIHQRSTLASLINSNISFWARSHFCRVGATWSSPEEHPMFLWRHGAPFDVWQNDNNFDERHGIPFFFTDVILELYANQYLIDWSPRRVYRRCAFLLVLNWHVLDDIWTAGQQNCLYFLCKPHERTDWIHSGPPRLWRSLIDRS